MLKNRGLGSGPGALLGLCFVAVLLGGCPKKPVGTNPPVTAPAAITDVPSLLAEVRQRGSAANRLDAALEIQVEGLPTPYRGKFYGTIRIDRKGPEELGLWLQTYSLLGLPVLEFISRGERMEVFLPLEHTVLMNFPELLPGGSVEEFPLSSMSDVTLPLSLISEQIKLIFGQGFEPRYRYQFTETAISFMIREWSGDQMRREIEYAKPDLHLMRVRIYQEGNVIGGMDGRENSPGPGPESLLPRRIIIYQGEARATFKFDQVRANDQVTGPEVAFRPPSPDHRVILLTPPVK